MKKTYYIILLSLFALSQIQAQSTLTFTQSLGTKHWKENGTDWHIFKSAYIDVNFLHGYSDINLPTSSFSLETNHKFTIYNFTIYVLDLEYVDGGWVNSRNNTYVKITGYDALGNALKSQIYYPPDNANPPEFIGVQLSLNSFDNISKLEFEFDGTCEVDIDDISYVDNGLAYTLPYPGDGSLANPYQISTLDHLKFLSQHRMEWIYNYYQTADIDAAPSQNWDGGAGFPPIGDETTGWWFSGGYDGRGHTISNLFINRPSIDYVGLFKNLIGVAVNLGIVNATIYGGNYTGSLAGLAYASFAGRIEGCYSSNCIINGNRYVGGLIGYSGGFAPSYAGEYTYINSCFSSNCLINGYSDIGGLIGLTSTSAVYNSYCTGSTVRLLANGAQPNAGGLIGTLDFESEIFNCYSTASVELFYNIFGKTGGLIGWKNTSAYTGQTKNCFWDNQTSG